MKILLLFLVLNWGLAIGQHFGPPPPGCNTYFALDQDGDGITQFDIPLYLNQFVRPSHLAWYGIDLSGYQLNMYASEAAFYAGDPPIPDIYTNLEYSQACYLDFVYVGPGPEYPEGSPEYYEFSRCHRLEGWTTNSDYDGDGVLNGLEDVNGNLMLNDDDTDADGSLNFFDTDDDNDGQPTIEEDYNSNGDWLDDDLNSNGIPDYLDPEVSAPLSAYSFAAKGFMVYPNPAKGYLNVKGATGKAVVCDLSGKIVARFKDASAPLDISKLAAGLYLMRLTDEYKGAILKFIIE